MLHSNLLDVFKKTLSHHVSKRSIPKKHSSRWKMWKPLPTTTTNKVMVFQMGKEIAKLSFLSEHLQHRLEEMNAEAKRGHEKCFVTYPVKILENYQHHLIFPD